MGELQDIIRRRNKALRAAMKTEVGVIIYEMRTHFRRVTTRWKNKPSFKWMIREDRHEIGATFGPAPGERGLRWHGIDYGTGKYGPKKRPYFIRPKKGKYLKFQTGYSPNTRPGARFNAGLKRATGPWAQKVFVIHPGIKPRHFTKEYVDKQIRPNFRARIIHALERVK